MAEIKNVAGTAFIVAEWRAEENAAPDPTKVIDRSTGDAGLSALGEHFARLGAPWITGIDDRSRSSYVTERAEA